MPPTSRNPAGANGEVSGEAQSIRFSRNSESVKNNQRQSQAIAEGGSL